MKQIIRISQIIVVATVLLWILEAIFIVHIGPHEIGVRKSAASGVSPEDLTPGWGWRLPGVHSIVKLPSSYYFLDYSSDDNNDLKIRTKDNNNVRLDVSVPVRIKPGRANKLVSDGNNRKISDDRYRYQELAEKITVSVLREYLAELDSVGFYNSTRRLEVAGVALEKLNEALEPLHLEAEVVLIRAVRFRSEYENQLQQIQLNEQNKLLDQARQKVADQQQELDNYQSGTNAQASAREQDWIKRKADLERAYEVGFVSLGNDIVPGAARRALAALSEEELTALKTEAAEVYGVDSIETVSDEYLMGIKNIEAETREYAKRVKAESDGIAARLEAEGEAKLAIVRGQFETRVNALLSSPAGRAYVAWKSAAKIKFDENLTFNSSDGIPSVLRLRQFAQQFMGGR